MKSIKKINTTKFEIIEAQELWAQNVIEIGNFEFARQEIR